MWNGRDWRYSQVVGRDGTGGGREGNERRREGGRYLEKREIKAPQKFERRTWYHFYVPGIASVTSRGFRFTRLCVCKMMAICLHMMHTPGTSMKIIEQPCTKRGIVDWNICDQQSWEAGSNIDYCSMSGRNPLRKSLSRMLSLANNRVRIGEIWPWSPTETGLIPGIRPNNISGSYPLSQSHVCL